MFKNKHFIVALLVAPILAVITYFGIDIAVSEKPHAAKHGESYKLASKSNCRYTSGLCDFENGEFKVQFRSEKLTDNTLDLTLSSKFPLQGIKVALTGSEQTQQPIAMTSTNKDMRHWAISLPVTNIKDKSLRVAIQADDTYYYGETDTTFVVYETLFTEEK
ncbi:hypothetical protein A9264_11550 [Vibrio sp. UCD-FRSSP16_10]|uniref:hypothetical protein n=1 Tax=unclassified Vibrio TaxID=2614977 RepID=UPI000801374A|nr:MULTISPECIES: hypothetical protein [unclassified Vibrio]OBT16439.1 hypothetical protein A9260_11760 [Vibrio sp. UCD-FRSSP16_30]OBT21304.1 hypothetical protein A9264_11550 [Vibrio sp. UCD-FRSSP16_10]